MNYERYKTEEWVTAQREAYEDENSGSIMDDFKE